MVNFLRILGLISHRATRLVVCLDAIALQRGQRLFQVQGPLQVAQASLIGQVHHFRLVAQKPVWDLVAELREGLIALILEPTLILCSLALVRSMKKGKLHLLLLLVSDTHPISFLTF